MASPFAVMEAWLQPRRWWTLGIILPVVAGIHLLAAAITIRHSNQDWTASDQGAEMWLAETSRTDLFPQRTDGVRHPLWSWFARHIFVDDKPQFFERGKWLNTVISIVFLCALGAAVTRWLDPLATANLLLLGSLGIFLVRGTYFQPEPIYYVAFFLVLVSAWKILRDSVPWGFYPIFGVLCGAAFLAKPSLTPFLLVFAVALALRILLSRVMRDGAWKIPRVLAGMAAAFLLLAALIAPLGVFSQKYFGKPFFNYPQYWMWMDDFEAEAWPWQTKYPGRIQLDALPKSEFPSAAGYFQRHSPSEAVRRLWSGIYNVKVRFLFPENKTPGRAFFWKSGGKKWEQPLAHRGIYLLVFAGVCAVLAAMEAGPRAREFMQPGPLSCAALAAGTVSVYILLYGWYWPIGHGDRFMGSLWLPGIFLVIWLASVLRRKASAKPWASRLYLGAHGLVLVSLLLQAASLFWLFAHGMYLVTRN